MLEVEPVATPFTGGAIEIVAANRSSNANTEIMVRKVETDERARVVFTSDCGLRILEELDLASWWMRSSSKGYVKGNWLYKINGGGWYGFESSRDDFYMKHENKDFHEFLIKGYRDCVSVFALDMPVVETVYSI